MNIVSLFGGGRARQRVRAVGEFPFPAGARQRFALHHPDLGTEDLAAAEAATRQWFRVVAGNPRARLAVPCVAVDRLWQELTLHTHEYAGLCDRAFGRFLPYQPDGRSAGPDGSAGGPQRHPATATADEPGAAAALLRTLALARRDEGCDDRQLPLLFRIDADLRLPDGRRYLADCGGRYQCFAIRGRTCLRHLGGVPRRARAEWGSPARPGYRRAYHGDGVIGDSGDGGGWGWGDGGGGWGDGGGGGGGD